MAIVQGVNGWQHAQSGSTQDHEVVGQIRGLLEAWSDGDWLNFSLNTQPIERRRRIRELRDLLSYDYLVNVLTGHGSASDKDLLVTLQGVM